MRVEQALGGTNQPGVPASTFAMPPGMRMRYDVPHPALAACVTGYAIYISDHRAPMINWYLPAPAMIVILLDAGPMSVTIGNRRFDRIERASVYGPTSRAYRTTTQGGVSVGIGLSAEGWARLTGRSARTCRDQIVPLTELVGAHVAGSLPNALDTLDNDAAIAPLLDQVLPRLFSHEHSDAALTQALGRLVLTDGVIGVDDVAARLGVDARALRQVATRWFGMTPKPLLTRARFVRSFARWLREGEPASYAGIDSSYFDVAHFLRDAQSYLGTTPRRFVRQEVQYLRASLRARAATIGASAHVLHAEKKAVAPIPTPILDARECV